MPDVIHDLYQSRIYPPMSHPLSDPAVSVVAARMAGLKTPVPRSARILEIGCSSGHNLIPLAMRWPEARFTGIDLVESAVVKARERAAMLGLGNIEFLARDLREFGPLGEPFDFIIAHGFFSWVPDKVKLKLLDFCRRNLSLSGIATVSFNLECGWKARLPVIAKARAIQQAGAVDEMSALAILRTVTSPQDAEIAIIDDMMAKGPAILPFDDFAPVNDPWPLKRFESAAADAGLRWLGASDPGEDFPSMLSEGDLAELMDRGLGPLDLQIVIDEMLGRTFRSDVLCRDDAPVEQMVPPERVLEFSLRAGAEPGDPEAGDIHRAIRSFAPACVSCEKVATKLTNRNDESLVRRISKGIRRGWIRARIEPVDYPVEPPEFPKLDLFRMSCAREGLPLVDAWHQPCSFPAGHYQVLVAMDGSCRLEELEVLAKRLCPELAFAPWIHHLAGRGFFT